MTLARRSAVALTASLLLLVRVPAAAGEARDVAAEALAPPPDDVQRGLFLQHTVGDLDAALAAYGAALEGRPPGLGADALRLLRAECLAWRGDGPGLGAALQGLRRPDAAASGPEAPWAIPAGADVVAVLVLERLRGTPWGDALLASEVAAFDRALRPPARVRPARARAGDPGARSDRRRAPPGRLAARPGG